MPSLRVALAQLNVTVGDLDGNRRLIEAALLQARGACADLVVVPELAITGYPPEDLLLKPSFVAANRRVLRALAHASQGLTALVGFVDQERPGRLYNAAAVLSHGRHVATYRKQHLPNYGVFDERRYFTPGDQPLVLDIAGWRLGVMICEDLWATPPSAQLSRRGVQLAVNLSASPYHAGKWRQRQQLFAQRARDNHLGIAYCNLVGGQDELVFDGGSVVLDAQGRLQQRARQLAEDFLVVDLPAERFRTPHRRAGSVIRLRAGRAADHPPAIQAPRPLLAPLEERYTALVLGLRDYVRKNGFSTVVLGLSGGIDSALTACLAVDALGAAHVVGVVMPSRFSSAATQADARQLARRLGLRLHECSIEPVFRSYLKTLAPVFKHRPADVTEQNLQARIRGNLLMALSNKFGWLVLTTGNKSELATGYCTLYGDMAGGFAVIKDVPKTLVYRLARYRNARGPGQPVAASVLRRAPSAELARHQTDQDTLPPYPLLDRIITAYVEKDISVPALRRALPGQAAVVTRVARMIDRAEYKRRQGAPGIKITPKAFGKDRRMPITNRYDEA
jgi:NAD+ synthase (glutamine-hydrolysing)